MLSAKCRPAHVISGSSFKSGKQTKTTKGSYTVKAMKHQPTKKIIKQGCQLLLFLLLMALTFYTIFHNNDIGEIFTALKSLQPSYFFLAVLCALFFVCTEGFMIWYLLQLTGKAPGLIRCFGYSFIGFFFSGITPSATGGQPAQLVSMKKDGIPLGDSTLTLMAVALLYKLVLVLTGIGLLFFRRDILYTYLGGYMALYYLGLFLNSLLVVLLLLVMFHGQWMERLLLSAEQIGIRLHLCRLSEKRREVFHRTVADYQSTLGFFLTHKSKILFAAFCTFLQRCSLFLLTYLIYRGMGLSGFHAITVMLLQAAIYISVDMLPLPGSQGISELMYHTVFAPVFTGGTLAASMCITRGISFYLLLLLGFLAVCKEYCFRRASAAAPYFQSR